MFESIINKNNWTLRIDGELFLRHSEEHPFATAVRHEKTYTAVRGTVQTETIEKERIPLTEAARQAADLSTDFGQKPFCKTDSVRFSANGHYLDISVTECAGGAELTLSGEEDWSYEFRFEAVPEEAVFGGGEQYRQTNLRGEKVVNFVSEHIKARTILEKAFRPASKYLEKTHSEIGSYSPMPFFVTDRGRVFLFKTRCDGISDFTLENEYVFSFEVCPAKLLLLKGGSYREITGFLNAEYPNRQYLPDWCMDGMILGAQGGREMVLSKVFSLLDAGAKICGVWSQEWSGENRTVMGKQVWWNWETDEELYPDLPGMIQELRVRGVRFLGYINPYLVKNGRLYEYCLKKGYLIQKTDGSICHIRSTTFDAGMLDLTNPEVVTFIKEELIGKNMLGIGMSGWMADFGEYLPVDCVLHDGDPAELHNEWPLLWAKINRDAIREYAAAHPDFREEDVFFFSRSGYLGIQKYAPIMWNGDQHTDFTKDYGMPSVIPASFSLGFSGVTMVHADIGGFFTFGKLFRDREVFIRWMEMCTFSLLMRSHESLRPWVNAQPFHKEILPYTVMLTNVHVILKPYLLQCIKEAQSGIPAMRPDFWEKMNYSESREPYAYFLGNDLFVAPVIKKGTAFRTVHLPEGKWVHLWTGKHFPGNDTCMVNTPLGRIPVFYREGSEYSDIFRAAAKENVLLLREFADRREKAAGLYKVMRDKRRKEKP